MQGKQAQDGKLGGDSESGPRMFRHSGWFSVLELKFDLKELSIAFTHQSQFIRQEECYCENSHMMSSGGSFPKSEQFLLGLGHNKFISESLCYKLGMWRKKDVGVYLACRV